MTNPSHARVVLSSWRRYSDRTSSPVNGLGTSDVSWVFAHFSLWLCS